MKKSFGFTLIELITTIAVIAILATIAVPGFQRMMAASRVAADYNEILSGLNYARSEAIKRRKDVTFDVTSTSPWAYQVKVDGITDPIRVRSGRDSITNFNDESFFVTFNSLGKRDSCYLDCRLTLSSSASYAQDRNFNVNIVGRVSGGSS
ncbi:GspH/FimT family pseudopilin [Halomonas sp. CKK8]|uniref:GspH/FimT family pseudopilin n=1 Tax=Halomonas sp. CKK8 TaxID=3036127 RepID=UPI0024152C77|nr:GspH/FimT family pseudopilin [Halomonas sp. CKK8]WFM70967.1 GspH/FimT family pseudopilin [Halomonas sp. CKK8]